MMRRRHGRCGWWWGPAALGCAVAVLAAAAPARGEQRATVAEAVRTASVAYADAYNARDYPALAAQWVERAELVEGASRVEGREAIVASIRGWLERHPQARLAIEIADVDVLAEPLARVRGTMRFSEREGAEPITTRFESLRVLEGGVWRLAESVVAQAHAAALGDLAWLTGSWRADGGEAGRAEMTFERAVGGYCLVGRGSLQRAGGGTVDSLMLFHPDRAAGLVRAWVFDSTGARGEGVVQYDGTTIHVTFIGTPAEGAGGRTAAWVQVIAPAGDRGFTMHAIERSIDGVPVADGAAWHFTRAP